MSHTLCMGAESPTMSYVCATFFFRVLVSTTSAPFSTAFLRVMVTLFRSGGFWMKS